MALEPAGGLTCTVTVAAGAPVERLDVDGHDESVPRAAWRKFDVGEEFVVEGQRVMLRPRGGGGAGVVFSCCGGEPGGRAGAAFTARAAPGRGVVCGASALGARRVEAFCWPAAEGRG